MLENYGIKLGYVSRKSTIQSRQSVDTNITHQPYIYEFTGCLAEFGEQLHKI